MTRFIPGRAYSTRTVSLHNDGHLVSFEVVRRNETHVWLKGQDGQIKRCRIREMDGAEQCDPMGSSRMSPILTAY